MVNNHSFDRNLFVFLQELRKHNNREWFQSNKARYEKEVRDPFLQFIADLRPALKKINPYIVADPSIVGGSMMRIYRDIRFSKDKSPYKTFVAAHFWDARGKDGAAPAYYLHLASAESSIGSGIWRPEPNALNKIRKAIVSSSDKWKKITTGKDFRSTCGMAGESLQRPPAGFDPNHPLIEDIKRKDFVTSSPRLSDRDVCGKNFADLVLDYFRATAPFLRFLSEAVGLRSN
jgi:uncharacterized protein (TIGR02453 family)